MHILRSAASNFNCSYMILVEAPNLQFCKVPVRASCLAEDQTQEGAEQMAVRKICSARTASFLPLLSHRNDAGNTRRAPPSNRHLPAALRISTHHRPDHFDPVQSFRQPEIQRVL